MLVDENELENDDVSNKNYYTPLTECSTKFNVVNGFTNELNNSSINNKFLNEYEPFGNL